VVFGFQVLINLSMNGAFDATQNRGGMRGRGLVLGMGYILEGDVWGLSVGGFVRIGRPCCPK